MTTTSYPRLIGRFLIAALLMATIESLAHGQDAVAAATSNLAALGRPTRQVLVSIPDRKLAVVENDEVLRVFPVAVGASNSPSPSGEFRIVNRLTNPTYYHPGTVIAPGPDNPLGTRWIGLDRKGYGIHGTNVPRSIGKAASHGCIRLGKHDLESLFDLVRVGDTVSIRAQADSQTAAVFASTNTVVAQTQPVASGDAAGGQ